MNEKRKINNIKRRRIGILGGISYKSTLKYYELIHQKYYERFHDYNYPEIVIYSFNFQKFTDLEFSSKKKEYIEYINEAINAVEKAGVDFVLMAANSPHAVFNDLKKRAKIPLLSIVEATAEKARKEGMKKVLLLGIKFTMQSSFYHDVFSRYGINIITPSSEEQDEINKIIFDELVIGVFKEESKNKLLNIISNYQIDGTILGCTELPLLLKQEDTTIKLLDTVEIHVEAALNYSVY